MIVYEYEYSGFLDTITAPFRWLGNKISHIFHSSPSTPPEDIYGGGGAGVIKQIGNTPVGSSTSSTSLSEMLKESLGKQLSPSLSTTLGLPKPKPSSLEKNFLHFVTNTPTNSSTAPLKVNWIKQLGPSLGGIVSKPLKVTSIHQIHQSSIWESLKNALSNALAQVGKTVIVTTTQAAAQALAYKIQKELGLTPVIRQTVGGYAVQVHRPPNFQTYTSTPHTSQTPPPPPPPPPPPSPPRPSSPPISVNTTKQTPQVVVVDTSAKGGSLKIDPKLLLLGGVLLLLLASRR